MELSSVGVVLPASGALLPLPAVAAMRMPVRAGVEEEGLERMDVFLSMSA